MKMSFFKHSVTLLFSKVFVQVTEVLLQVSLIMPPQPMANFSLKVWKHFVSARTLSTLFQRGHSGHTFHLFFSTFRAVCASNAQQVYMSRKTKGNGYNQQIKESLIK